MEPKFSRKLLFKPQSKERIDVDCMIAIVQDAETKEVLMHGFMNREAWDKTQETRMVHFWSTSRDELWFKGNESGNKMEVVYQILDCDCDAVLIGVKVQGRGVACHTGARSCFFNNVS